MAGELATNPFLRPDNTGLQSTVGLMGAPALDVFAETRTRNDHF